MMTNLKNFGWFVLKVYLAMAAMNFVMGLLPDNLVATLAAFRNNPTAALGMEKTG